jgi:hypothetical protein
MPEDWAEYTTGKLILLAKSPALAGGKDRLPLKLKRLFLPKFCGRTEQRLLLWASAALLNPCDFCSIVEE